MELRYLDITEREQNTQKAPIRKKKGLNHLLQCS